MAKIKFEHGLEVEHDGEEYILRFKAPRVKLDPDLTGGHLKQAKREGLLAVRSIIGKAIKVEEEKDKE